MSSVLTILIEPGGGRKYRNGWEEGCLEEGCLRAEEAAPLGDAPEVASGLEGTLGAPGLGALLGLSMTSARGQGYGVRCAQMMHGAHLNLGVTVGGKAFA